MNWPFSRGHIWTPIKGQTAALKHGCRKLASKSDEIVIDVGGRNTDSLRAALIVADAVLVPFQPRSVDLWAAPQRGAIIAEACAARPARPLPAYSVLNATDPQGPQGRDNEDAATTLRAIEGVEHLPVMIGRRKAIPNAFSDGLAVTEQNPKDAKAVNEMLSVVSVLYRQKVHDDDKV
jgi:chromosome partitioning protein